MSEGKGCQGAKDARGQRMPEGKGFPRATDARGQRMPEGKGCQGAKDARGQPRATSQALCESVGVCVRWRQCLGWWCWTCSTQRSAVLAPGLARTHCDVLTAQAQCCGRCKAHASSSAADPTHVTRAFTAPSCGQVRSCSELSSCGRAPSRPHLSAPCTHNGEVVERGRLGNLPQRLGRVVHVYPHQQDAQHVSITRHSFDTVDDVLRLKQVVPDGWVRAGKMEPARVTDL